MLPAGNASTCGLYSQPFWSNVTGSVGTSSALPFVAFTTTATSWMPPPEPTTSAGSTISGPFFPHTSWSLVTSIFFGAGGVPIELDGAAERAAVGDRR